MSFYRSLMQSNMRGGYGRNSYNKLTGQQDMSYQQAQTVEVPKHKYSICMNKTGYIATFDMDNYREGDDVRIRAYAQAEMSHGALIELADILACIPDNDELTETISLIYIPDALQYLVNGTIADYIRLGRDKQGTIIPNDKLELMKEVFNALHSKWMNVIVRPYSMANAEDRALAKNWIDTIARQKAAEAVGGMTVASKQTQQQVNTEDTRLTDYKNAYNQAYMNDDVDTMIRLAKKCSKVCKVDLHAECEVTQEEIDELLAMKQVSDVENVLVGE